MDEAERLCDRVAVVDHGKVIALGTPRELIAKLGGEHFIDMLLEGDGALAIEDLQPLPGVVNVRREDGLYSLAVTAPHQALPALLEFLQGRGYGLAQLTTRHASLEDVFVTLTGRHLRDEG